MVLSPFGWNADLMRVILASQSPRRRELLSLIGIEHEVQPADIDETPWPEEQPIPHTERLARAKAQVIAARAPDALVIAADTIVVIDGAILGKPTDIPDARAMLRRLKRLAWHGHEATARKSKVSGPARRPPWRSPTPSRTAGCR